MGGELGPAMTEPIVWPLAIRPLRQSFWLASRTTRFGNPVSGASQCVEWQGTRWRAELVLRRMGSAAREVDALVAALNGPVGTVLLPDFRRLAARNPLGAPTLTGGSGSRLTVADLGGTLRPGDLIQIAAGRAVMVTAESPPGPLVTVPIAPPQRIAPAVGPLVASVVRVLMRLVDDDQTENPTRAAGRTDWRLAFEEVLA